MKSKFETIDEYVSSAPAETHAILTKIRKLIAQIAPEATEAISYQIPTFKLKGKNLIHFAGYKNHIGLYPTSSGKTAFEKEVSRYKSGKGSIRFPLSEPIPYDLIKAIVRFRMQELNK